MRLLFAIGLLLTIGKLTFAQIPEDNYHYYTLEEIKNAFPDTVLAIDLSKNKLTSLPDEIQKFKNLEALKVSKNKLSELPDFFTEFTNLRFLYLDRNNFIFLPHQLFYTDNLEYLTVAKNKIQSIPAGIKNLKKLLYFDIWDNRVQTISPAFTSLQQLKIIDFRGVTFSPEFVEEWTKAFPNTDVKFDPPCNCIK